MSSDATWQSGRSCSQNHKTVSMPMTDLVQNRHDLQQQLGAQSSLLELPDLCKQGSTAAVCQQAKASPMGEEAPLAASLPLAFPLALGA